MLEASRHLSCFALEDHDTQSVVHYTHTLQGRTHSLYRILARSIPRMHRRLDEQEVSAARSALLNWLPTILAKSGVVLEISLEVSDYHYGPFERRRGSRLRERAGSHKWQEHLTRQSWGVRPSASDIASVGMVLECAGPTFDDERSPPASLPTVYRVSPDLISNIELPHAQYEASLDAVIDATNMGIASESVGAVFISALPKTYGLNTDRNNIHNAAIEEAWRVLKTGGRLAWAYGTPHDLEKMLSVGFLPESTDTDILFYEFMDPGEFELRNMVFHGSFLKPV